MKIFTCLACHLKFEIKEEEQEQEKIKCPRCGSLNVTEITDKLSSVFNNFSCGINKKST
ncbi:hypothetical protein [Candidatus Oleimmundimicrobium sp.]|uniref:hypothetical protein n=1 Tax=Candidatus Oleimmundimicrobium sp. TaxID=3060597 RepID=UPI0027202B34|nr:hypothetical protein [Candidatus Oleimmundimicrobium sp.]MDO8885681.1 hypothetical protein [Candidatus Oleimmundimicrobium sp.]